MQTWIFNIFYMHCVYYKLHRQTKGRIRTAITTNKNEAIEGNCNAQEAMRKVFFTS